MKRALPFRCHAVWHCGRVEQRALIQLQEFISAELEVAFLNIICWAASGWTGNSVRRSVIKTCFNFRQKDLIYSLFEWNTMCILCDI